MQIRIRPESIKTILDDAGCEISHESEKQVVAVKRVNYGRIYIRIKRQAVPYALEPEERFYWLADIHFEKGLRPHRLFDSKEVRVFIERYVNPFTDSFPKRDPISLTIDGTRALAIHKKELLLRKG